MDESVEEDGEKDISVVQNMYIDPVEKEDGGVVINMKERKLLPFFAKDDENGVPEIPDF